MDPTESFETLMDRLRDGDDGAARVVFLRFARQLIALTRRRLDGRLARKVDPEDVVQSAYKSFFIRQRAGQLQVGTWQGLWGLLTVITMRKCADRVDYFRAARRDERREAGGEAGEMWEKALDREPLPQEAAAMAETVEDLFRRLDPDERPILELSLQGFTAGEIGEQLGRAERTVRRLRERIRKRLERMQEE